MDVQAVAHKLTTMTAHGEIDIEHVTTYRDAVIIIYRIPGIKQKIAYCYDFAADDDAAQSVYNYSDPDLAAVVIFYNYLIAASLPDHPSQNLGVDDIEWFGDKYDGPDIRI